MQINHSAKRKRVILELRDFPLCRNNTERKHHVTPSNCNTLDSRHHIRNTITKGLAHSAFSPANDLNPFNHNQYLATKAKTWVGHQPQPQRSPSRISPNASHKSYNVESRYRSQPIPHLRHHRPRAHYIVMQYSAIGCKSRVSESSSPHHGPIKGYPCSTKNMGKSTNRYSRLMGPHKVHPT